MAESRMFVRPDDMGLDSIVTAVETFMCIDKGMEMQSAQTADGYVIQGSHARDGWKTSSGTRLAITVQFIVSGRNLNAMIGEGQWSDKIGVDALGRFVAWPLALTAGIGTYKQKRLPQEIFSVIEKCILSGGQCL